MKKSISRLALLTFTALAASSILEPAETQLTELPLMPWPSNVSVQSGSVPINGNFSVSISGPGATDPRVTGAVQRLFNRVQRQTGILIIQNILQPGDNPVLDISVGQPDHDPPQKLRDNESYSLVISSGHVKLSADQPLGVLRGIETFLQLIRQNQFIADGPPGGAGFSVPAVIIHDEPRFPWRGLSLDVSRHFIPVEGIKRTIDGLAAVKLNVLHWHLSDDQGFRVESKRYPRLQGSGSDGLFYTQSEIRDIISYAADRGVRVVPEFDMPGHASSWLPGYPDLGTGKGTYKLVRDHGILTSLLDPTQEYTYEFLDNFIGEMAEIFPDEYFHIGGDEVAPKEWNESAHVRAFMAEHKLATPAALQAYFNQRLLAIVTKHGKKMEGWDEILHGDLPKSIVIQTWRGQPTLWKAARQGYQGILSAGYYLDLTYPAAYHYAVDPMKSPPATPGRHGTSASIPGAETDLTSDQQKLVLGGEAAMWEELATPENLDAKLWPRLAAIAERFWSPEAITDPASMYRRLTVTNRWLEWLDLRQQSNLELMRKRLVADADVEPLDKVAAILEPVKGYARHAKKFTSLSPLNSLVDSIPPESEPARQFREAVDRYLKTAPKRRTSQALRLDLVQWARASEQVRPLMQANLLLREDLPVAGAVESLCQAGQDALSYLDSGNAAPSDWKRQASATASKYSTIAAGDLLIQIAPAVQKLVQAVPEN